MHAFFSMSSEQDCLDREVVQSLIDEYKAAETAEYVHWGSEPMSEYEDARTALGGQAAADNSREVA